MSTGRGLRAGLRGRRGARLIAAASLSAVAVAVLAGGWPVPGAPASPSPPTAGADTITSRPLVTETGADESAPGKVSRQRSRERVPPASAGLPTRWCGQAADAKRGEHRGAQQRRPHVKAVIAWPADVPVEAGELRRLADGMQRAASTIGLYLATQSDAPGVRAWRTLRWDLGLPCSPRALDLAYVRLPQGWQHYAHPRLGLRRLHADAQKLVPAWRERRHGPARDRRGPRLITAVLALPPGATPPRSPEAADGGFVCGLAAQPRDDRAGAGNAANNGGRWSMIFGRSCLSPRLVLHEVLHMLGAVQPSAPHGTAGHGHCRDGGGAEIMCYGSPRTARERRACPEAASDRLLGRCLDAGRDDYWAPRPRPGSYLATHWNTYHSLFLGGCGELLPACGAFPAAADRARRQAARPWSRRPWSHLSLTGRHAGRRVSARLSTSWGDDGALRVAVRLPRSLLRDAVPSATDGELIGHLCMSWTAARSHRGAVAAMRRPGRESDGECVPLSVRGRATVRISAARQARVLARSLDASVRLAVQDDGTPKDGGAAEVTLTSHRLLRVR